MKKTDKRFTAKKWITILLAFSLMVSVLPALSLSALAADSLSGTCGDQLRWSFEKGTGKLTVTGSGAMDDYAYDPSADPEGRMVPWYDYLGSIMTVELPEGLTHIGDYSFCGSWISSITIPASVTSIGDAPFYRCRALKEFKVGSGSNTYSTDNGVLLNRDKTEVLLYPPAREGDYVIPDTVVRIGEYAFDSTRITAVTIPEGVSEIAYMAFSCCYELQSVSIPGSVKTVGEEAFFGCHELQSAVMGSGVTGIGDGAFACCSSLEAVRFPDSLEYIGEDAFASCEALTDVIIPENVTFIGSDAFGDCASLQSFTVEPRNPAFCSVEGILFSKDQTELIRYPQAKAGDYQIPSNVEKLGETAFQRCRGLTALTIPSGIKQIPANQFLACENLKSVEIAESVESIGVRAFFGCASLESITIPTGVTEIGTEVFLSCESLKNVKIPDSVTRIGMGAFAACTALEEIRIPGSVSEIESGAFFDCRSLKRVAISDGVTTIGSDAFVWCRQLRNVVLPRSVKQIEQDAFHKCGELGVLTIMNEGCRIDDVNAPEDTIIRGYRGSTAETFAKEHGYVFEALSKETEFADVLEKAFYEKAVVWAVENQVTNGTGEYTFSPDQACTRGQVVTFLWRAAGCPEPAKTENPFTDVKKGAFYYKAVLWAVENGVTKGTSDTTFSPDATCTRGQIVTFLYRAKGSPELTKKENPFKDVADGQFYAEAVAWAVENNVTKGKSADTFAPNATCTRGEVVTFLYRAMSDPKADDPNPVEPEPALTEVNAMLIRGPSKNGNDTLPTQTVTVSSAKELQDFLESCYDINHVIGLAADKYSDAYFVNNVLLLTPIRVCGSSPGFTITSVTEKEDQIEVELAKPGDPESPDMCAWVLLIEAAKSMPEREIVIHTTYGERPEYEFTASDTVELMSWINAEIAEPSEKWKYFEDFMNEVKKNNSILIAQPATEAFSLQEILVGSFGTTLSIRFQRSDREDDRIAIDISLSDDTLEDRMERVIKSSTKFYEDWTYEKATAKVNGVDTEIYFWSGDFTIKGSDHKDHFPPTAIFSYMGHVVTVEGCDGLRQAAWDNAWLEQFTFSTVELT